jgi:hypothetical protein
MNIHLDSPGGLGIGIEGWHTSTQILYNLGNDDRESGQIMLMVPAIAQESQRAC